MSESYLKYDQQQYLTEKCQSKINNEISSLHSCHHSLLKIAIFKKNKREQMLARMWRKGNFYEHCGWKCYSVESLWKTVWWFLKKLKIQLPYDLAIPLLSIYLEGTEIQLKELSVPTMFISASFIIAKTEKLLKCSPRGEWIKKWGIYLLHTTTISVNIIIFNCIYLFIYTSIKTNEVLPFVTTQMKLEGIMLSEISQTKRNFLHYQLYVSSQVPQW